MIGAVYISTNYMIVDRIERLYNGPRFYGYLILMDLFLLKLDI